MKKLIITMLMFNAIVISTITAQTLDENIAIRFQNETGIDVFLCFLNNSNKPGEVLIYNTFEDEFKAEIWEFYKTEDGYYYIINTQNGLYLEPQLNPVVAGSKIIQQRPKGSDIQKWRVTTALNFSYYILPKTNDELYITIKGANVVLSTYQDVSRQKWGISRVCFPSTSLIRTEGGFKTIDSIKQGDEVATWDTVRQMISYSPVDSIYVHDKDSYKLTKITFIDRSIMYASRSDYHYIQSIEGTSNHPLLTPSGYKPIAGINDGDIIYYYSEYENKPIECVVVKIERDVRSVDAVYNLKPQNGMPYIVNSAIASPKCPYVSIVNGNTRTEVSEILRNQLSKHLDIADEIDIPVSELNTGVLEIMIDERKDEITYLDQVYLKINGLVIYPEKSNVTSLIDETDEEYLIMKKGDSIRLKFTIPAGIKVKNAKIVAKGYYELDEDDQSI